MDLCLLVSLKQLVAIDEKDLGFVNILFNNSSIAFCKINSHDAFFSSYYGVFTL